ncbi:hypothetical protein [Bradyrhizobium sp. ORS 86]|uniref:hypothetical protein n=1 Tax=Bradyrhizobium sp. ORS 86 TaxID=1685970 RepID=UPI00388EE7A8
MSVRIASYSLSALLTCVATISVAADCSFLKIDPFKLQDGQLFYQLQTGSGWVEMNDLATLANRKVTFAYVIQEKIDQGRGGVAVMKSARVRQLDEPALPANRSVDLVRDTTESDPSGCAPVPLSKTAKVPSKSYDDYHDYGRRVHEQAILDDFHYNHEGRRGRCTKTNSMDGDPRTGRSNRAQFSFDPRVVNGEVSFQAFSFIAPRQALAGSSDSLSEQRVEMQSYRVRRGLPTCVVFSLTVPARAGFLRINDLDGLKANGLYYDRSDEKNWTLSR